MSFLSSILNLFGTKSQRDMKELSPTLKKCKDFEERIAILTNDELREKTKSFKNKISQSVNELDTEILELKSKIEIEQSSKVQEELFNKIEGKKTEKSKKISDTLNLIMEEAFAVIKETAKRFSENDQIKVSPNENDIVLSDNCDYVKIEGNNCLWNTSWISGGVSKKWDMVHYDVQLIGGLVLHNGKIAEMQTGEGKTLVATLPIYLNALTGLGVHVVTVNDYLAKRDSEWMGSLFEFHGLKVDCIDKYSTNSPERRLAYLSDITYGTNNEFGFDYLRDNMTRDAKNLVQREHHYAIIDEVDSVLIDDARTPLIISGPVERETKQEFQSLKSTVEILVKEQRRIVNNELILAKRKINAGDEKE